MPVTYLPQGADRLPQVAPSPIDTLGVPYWDEYIQSDDPLFYTPPDAWSVGYYGPNRVPIPGLCAVVWRKHPKRIIDKTHKPATDGCNPTLLGFDVSEFDLKVKIASRDQFQRLQDMRRAMFPGKSPPVTGSGLVGLDFSNVTAKSTKAADPNAKFQVIHPSLLTAGITEVVVEGWTPPMPDGSSNDIWVVLFHCMEYSPSKKKHAAKVKSGPGVPTNKHLQPKTAAENPPSKTDGGPGLTSLKKTG